MIPKDTLKGSGLWIVLRGGLRGGDVVASVFDSIGDEAIQGEVDVEPYGLDIIACDKTDVGYVSKVQFE